ncbi:MAG: glyoxylate/hydroxypyruvate reductase A [Alphaproteobacteria bacterium]
MPLLFISKSDDPHAWRAMLAEGLPDLEVRVWPEAGDPSEIEFALAWKPEAGLLARFSNLKLIQSLGMGVDHIFVDPELPEGVPVARLVDPDMVRQMGEYVIFAALRHHRHMDAYDANQRAGRWASAGLRDTPLVRAGVLGLGAIGGDTAMKLASLGFQVAGWSRTPKSLDGIESFHGDDGFAAFLQRTDILVCLLPLTPETLGILDAAAFGTLPEGAYVINLARGGHVVEDDLLAAIDRGHIAGATLDVFQTEPLPDGHPFWAHPKVHVTPHIAGLTNPRTSAAQVIENIRRVRAGEAPHNLVDAARGY